MQLLLEKIDPKRNMGQPIVRNTDPQLVIRNTTRNVKKKGNTDEVSIEK